MHATGRAPTYIEYNATRPPSQPAVLLPVRYLVRLQGHRHYLALRCDLDAIDMQLYCANRGLTGCGNWGSLEIRMPQYS